MRLQGCAGWSELPLLVYAKSIKKISRANSKDYNPLCNGYFGNIEDPEEMHNAAFHHGLH